MGGRVGGGGRPAGPEGCPRMGVGGWLGRLCSHGAAGPSGVVEAARGKRLVVLVDLDKCEGPGGTRCAARGLIPAS